jgi:sialate O-acetylesterase
MRILMPHLFLVLLFCPYLSMAQLKVAAHFSDHMVLPRDKPLVIRGTGVPAKIVKASIASTHVESVIGPEGKWKIELPPLKKSNDPLALRLTMEEEVIQFENIVIGDVWLCIGQSNMEWPMNREMHWKDAQMTATQPMIRLLNPPPVGRNVYNQKFSDSLLERLNEEKFYDWNGWKECTPASVAGMSAVAYYFGRSIRESVDVPIGLINLSIGGAPLESFIGVDALKSDSIFKNKVEGIWLTNKSLPVWIRQRGLQNLDQVTYKYGDENGPNHAFKPGFAYKSGVLPLIDFPITGVLVYQGESNAEEKERVDEYSRLFALMVDQYRQNWSRSDLPFYWVQLSSIERQHWPAFRDEQRKLLLRIPNSGLAVSSDHGLRTDVHPTNKKVVGERLARWALADVYDQKIIPSGPLPIHSHYRSNKVVIKFNHASGLTTSDGNALKEFSVDGSTTAPAIIRGKRVIIAVKEKPVGVWYGWKPFSEGNLVNRAGLPASTFYLPID